MKEVDQLAAAVVEAVAHIIALPIKIVVWVAKAAKRSLKKPHGVGLGQWKKTGSKKKQAKAANAVGKTSSLDKHQMEYEDVPDKRFGGKNAGSRNTK